MVTAGTYQKRHHFRSPDRLSLLVEQLQSLSQSYGWQLQAWAVFSNHYHFVAISPGDPASLPNFLRHLHSVTAHEVNRQDNAEGRKVWHSYWDKHLTFERSYLARLNYVHQNAVRHGIVPIATRYRWCSAGWFEQNADRAFYKVVMSFKIDRLDVPNAYEVELVE